MVICKIKYDVNVFTFDHMHINSIKKNLFALQDFYFWLNIEESVSKSKNEK